uniref:Putative Response cheY-like response regulator n=1 Tax=Magnetococcus massalia (strain MO-1) TaxID=451514 RepID=A0A1S7LCF8_MAGMO|nr:putative Response cheY-like response regulator [Candidatus Magnetococcus massalia]
MGDRTVLVVDDSSLARMMLRNSIAQSLPEWQIIEAVSAEDALEKIATDVPQLALVDYNMPGKNGIELATELTEKYSDIRIVLVTANIQDRMRQRAEAMGIGFVTKPVSPEKLADLVTGLEGA